MNSVLNPSMLIPAVIAGIAVLLFFILVLKIQAFLSLLIASLVVGLVAGMPAMEIIAVMKTGMGETLGFVATVVGLGALFGSILESSGGASSIARFLLNKFGEKRAPWALMITGFIVAIPVFFDVAFIILAPLIYALQKKSGRSLLLYGIPLLAGLAITHCFIPPTPGPIAVADILGADLGWVIVFGIVVGIPTAAISGPFLGKRIAEKIKIGVPEYYEQAFPEQNPVPPVGLVLAILLAPIVLIVLNTVSNSELAFFNLPAQIKTTLAFLGDPFVALIIANLLAWLILGLGRGFTKKQLLEITSKSLAPAGIIILLTGAGGVFKQVLISTGAGEMLAAKTIGVIGSPLIFAFVAAAIVRVAQGSSTVAMITSAGMTASLMENMVLSDTDKALMVIAVASGAVIFSHVNDSGFWLVNRYLGISEKQTFRSWTFMTTVIALVSFGIVLILDLLI
ncbi:MAG TPA: gluconate transporter [Cytophagales bacterium]|nr:gluconate transporter [Cytophagales bacterium]